MAQEWPKTDPDTLAERIAGGLGGSRFREYDLPFYVEVTRAAIPALYWNGVWFSWLSLKGHLQGLHGVRGTDMFATRVGDWVYAVFIIRWGYAEELAAYLAEGYPLEEVLRSANVEAASIETVFMRDLS